MIDKIVLVFLVTFFFSLWLMQYIINKSVKKDYLCVKDMYKKSKNKIPYTGGLAIICGILVSLTVSQIFVREIDLTKLMVFYMIIIVFGVFGILDDLVDIGRKIKVFAPYFMALPIALLNVDTTLSLLFFTFNIGLWFSFLIAPIYIMVVSNLVNMHSGFNGLAGGLSLILLFFISVRVALEQSIVSFFYIIPLFATLFAFMFYNKYPSKIFLGNAGSYLVGAGIGASIIFFNMEIFGVVILIPHIINFLMWCVWLVLMKLYPKRFPHIKFTPIRKDGTIKPPNFLTMKYFVCYFFKLKEKQAVWVLYGITTLFGVIGLLVV